MAIKIIKAQKKEYVEVEVDDTDLPYCRRFGPNDWLYLSGTSWEEDLSPEALEAAYQEYLKDATTDRR